MTTSIPTTCPECDAPAGTLHSLECSLREAKPTKSVTNKTKKTTTDVSAVCSPAATLANNYFGKNIVEDFSAAPSHTKLALLQTTPPKFIAKRTIGGKQMPYLPHEYTTKALNFVFNFNVSTEILHSEFIKGIVGGKNVWDAEVMVKFTFTKDDGRTIVRTVYSGNRSYENPATTRADAMKGAISKAYSVVARQFGIGSNLVEAEQKVYREYEDEPNVKTPPPSTPPKAWNK